MASELSSSDNSCITKQPQSHSPVAPREHLLIPEGLKGRYQPPPARTRLSTSPHFPPKRLSATETLLTENRASTIATSPNFVREVVHYFPAKHTSETKTPATANITLSPAYSWPTAKSTLKLLREVDPTQKRPLRIELTMPRGLENRWIPPKKKVKRACCIKAAGSLATDASIQKKKQKNKSEHLSGSEGTKNDTVGPAASSKLAVNKMQSILEQVQDVVDASVLSILI